MLCKLGLDSGRWDWIVEVRTGEWKIGLESGTTAPTPSCSHTASPDTDVDDQVKLTERWMLSGAGIFSSV